jgi:hypothetical protein
MARLSSGRSPVAYELKEGKKFTSSLGVNGLSDLLAEKYNGRVKSGFIALDLAYWRMR